MRVLVTGASGLLGGRLARLLAARTDVVCARHRSPGPPELPEVALALTDPGSVEAAIESARPQAVVHSAALASADACLRDPDAARRLNVDAPAQLARLCRRHGIALAALSTDLVFDGAHAPYREGDRPRPILVYGHSKLAGEDAVRHEYPEAAVFRVALVHGRGFGPRDTASEAIARALREGHRVRLYTDQYRTTVDPESVADAVWRALTSGRGGLFHAGGPERTSRFELGLRVARQLGLPADRIDAVAQSDDTHLAPRPADVAMDCTHTRSVLGWEPRGLEEGIAEGR